MSDSITEELEAEHQARAEIPDAWGNLCYYATRGCPEAKLDRKYFEEYCAHDGNGSYPNSHIPPCLRSRISLYKF